LPSAWCANTRWILPRMSKNTATSSTDAMTLDRRERTQIRGGRA
jgi:hypothetical protein